MNFTASRRTTATEVKSCDYADYTMLDGYTWTERQKTLGYWANPSYGDWPLVMIVNGVNQENGNYVIKEFCEHDVKTWIYTANDVGREEYTHHLNQLKAYWKDRI